MPQLTWEVHLSATPEYQEANSKKEIIRYCSKLNEVLIEEFLNVKHILYTHGCFNVFIFSTVTVEKILEIITVKITDLKSNFSMSKHQSECSTGFSLMKTADVEMNFYHLSFDGCKT